MVVGAPGGDGLLDLLAVEVFGGGALGEGGYFGVGGEAEADELVDGEGIDEVELVFVEEVGEAELFFEANEAVLIFEGVSAGDAGHEEEDDGHDDPPEMGVGEAWPGVDGGVDGGDEVEQQQGHQDEVERGVEARVVLERLRHRHRSDDSAGWV